MNFDEYMIHVEDNYDALTIENLGSFETRIAYESKFELKWFASKLKIFSFFSYSEKIDVETIQRYSKLCFEHSRKNYTGLPRGIQNGFVSFAVLISNSVDSDAITYVKNRYKKHFSAFEMPVIINLEKEQIIFYNETPIWGGLYYNFLREYIHENFNHF